MTGVFDNSGVVNDPTLDRQKRDLVSSLDIIYQRWFLLRHPRAETPAELSAQQWRALGIIAFRGRMSMTELASSLGISVSTATRLIDRLVEKDVVVRARPESDRRSVEVELSDNGRRMNEAHLELKMSMADGMLSPLTPGERESFLNLLRKVSQPRPGDRP